MQPSRRLKLKEAWRSLAPGQGFRLLLLAIIALSAAAALGAVMTGSRDQRNLARKEDHVTTLVDGLTSTKAELERRYADLTVTQSDLLRRHAALETTLAAARTERKALVGEAEFLSRYIVFVGATGSGNAKAGDPRPVIETLCTLWRSDKPLARFETAPLELGAQDFEQGRLSPDLQTLLVSNFISLDPLQQVRVAEAQTGQGGKAGKPVAHAPALNATSAPPTAVIARQALSIKILKSVTFQDGVRFEIPRNIAVALQIRRECVPR